MGAPTDWPPPDRPEHPLVLSWDATEVVSEAYHLAMLGGQRLLGKEFPDASRLLQSASHLADRAAFLMHGGGHKLRDGSE